MSHGANLRDSGGSSSFLNTEPEAAKEKDDTLGFAQIKNRCASECERLFASRVPVKVLESGTCEGHTAANGTKTPERKAGKGFAQAVLRRGCTKAGEAHGAAPDTLGQRGRAHGNHDDGPPRSRGVAAA